MDPESYFVLAVMASRLTKEKGGTTRVMLLVLRLSVVSGIA